MCMPIRCTFSLVQTNGQNNSQEQLVFRLISPTTKARSCSKFRCFTSTKWILIHTFMSNSGQDYKPCCQSITFLVKVLMVFLKTKAMKCGLVRLLSLPVSRIWWLTYLVKTWQVIVIFQISSYGEKPAW